MRSQVYTQLKNQLVTGVWKAGEKLPSENELCQSLGVSRVTVRAAIQQLEILGLIETRHGGGNFVREYSPVKAMDAFHPPLQLNENQDIITVLEYRKIIEKGTIGLVAPKITTAEIVQLEENYALMVSLSGSGQPQKQAEVDHQFHYQLARIAGNPIITKVYEIINIILASAMVDIVKLLGTEMGLRYHRQLIDALKQGDKALCESTMEAHIEETIRKIKTLQKMNHTASAAGRAKPAERAARRKNPMPSP